MATCREWQKWPLHFPIIDRSKERTSAAKAASRARPTARLKVVPFPKQLMVSEGVTELSEIPCRVSSDLHEWRNESATVLPTDTANL
jgi:hypothetical protein